MTTAAIVTVLSVAVAAAAVAFAVMSAVAQRRRLAERDADCERRLAERDAACERQLADRDAACERLLKEKDAQFESFSKERDRTFGESLRTLREQFANLAEEKLKASADSLASVNRERLGDVIRPFREELDRFRKAFEENRLEQVANKASFEQAINNLGERALKIGANAESLARALKTESKTQGNWGEMVLSNILSAAGLKEGVDFLPQAQETDADGNRLIPDVEIPLPDGEKLLIDSKASVTAYLDYAAATDDAARECAVKAHLASVRKHMDELADKGYIKKVRGSQGYILMFIPNEGSYLLAMEHDRKLATDAFRRHVIIVNPTTLLLCLQIVMLLRSREAQNENAEKISAAAAKMYEKMSVFSETFMKLEEQIDGLGNTFQKAKGQLCEGRGNVVRQLEGLKGMGVVATKNLNQKLVESSEAGE